MIPSSVQAPSDTPKALVLVRRYPARAEALWALWTTAQGFASWWGPQGFRVEVHTLEAKAGGLLRYDMIADAPEMVAAMKASGQPVSHPVQATFGEFHPTRRLVLINTIDFIPGVPPYTSTIVVELEEEGPQTRMTVTLSPMHSPEFSRMQLEGFTSQLTKLDQRYGLEAQAQPGVG